MAVFNIRDPKTWPDAFVLDPMDSVTVVKPDDGVSFHLEQLYKLLEVGLIQVVRPIGLADTGYILVCDDEGLLKPDPQVNKWASCWYAGSAKAAVEESCYMVGRILVCKDELLK